MELFKCLSATLDRAVFHSCAAISAEFHAGGCGDTPEKSTLLLTSGEGEFMGSCNTAGARTIDIKISYMARARGMPLFRFLLALAVVMISCEKKSTKALTFAS